METITPSTSRHRRRTAYAALVVTAIVLGLASRRFGDALPPPLADRVRLYAGDAIWAAMVYFLGAAIAPHASIARLSIGALGFAWVIEVSQLYHAPWIEALRATRVGGLVLGFGFLWSDVVCYAVGVAFAALVDAVMRRRHGV